MTGMSEVLGNMVLRVESGQFEARLGKAPPPLFCRHWREKVDGGYAPSHLFLRGVRL